MAWILYFCVAPLTMKYLYAYRNIALAANVVTVLCAIEIWRSNSLTVVSVLAWVKIITTALLITYIHLFNEHIAFFFMNLGISRRKFYASMFFIDMTLFATLVTLVRLAR